MFFIRQIRQLIKNPKPIKILPLEDICFEDLCSENSNLISLSEDSYHVHFLWVEGRLSKLELLCINSFIHRGFTVNLWHYGDIPNAPRGTIKRDGREILAEDRIFTYENGSVAAFADLFRYKLLCEKGGLWVDTDVICLTTKDIFTKNKAAFWVSEFNNEKACVNNNLIFWPMPKVGDAMHVIYALANAFPIDKLQWGDCGPRLLQMIFDTYPQLAPPILPPAFCNPVPFTECPNSLLKEDKSLLENSHFLHCFNEMWRRNNVDKNIDYPLNSILRELELQIMPDTCD